MPELPMFPLGTVLLPHMVLPLHIFEPRYRAMTRDVLAGDREFGVVLIRRGHEVGGHDDRSDIGTVARIVRADELDDGRWLMLTVGTRRVRVTRWLEDDPYPRATVDDLPDEDTPAPVPSATEGRLRRVLAMRTELGQDGVPATFELEADPAVAAWQVAVIAALTPIDAQRVLETTHGEDRVALLDHLLRDLEQVLALQLRADDP